MVRTSFVASCIASLVAVQAQSQLSSNTIDDYDGFNAGKYGNNPSQSYVSSDLISPMFQVNTWEDELIDKSGFMFISPKVNAGGRIRGPMIFSKKDLSLVYANQTWETAWNTRVQQYKGKPYLTFWVGTEPQGHGLGSCLMVDQNYNLAYNITTSNIGTEADNHECQLTPDGTALVTAYPTRDFDMRPLNGPENGTLRDSAFQEIDIETGRAVFTWYASDHFNISDCAVPYANEDYGTGTDVYGWDFAHINSVQKTAAGDYLVSLRRLKAVVLISGVDGSVIWQVGGVNNMFKDLSCGKATNFGFQHNANPLDPEHRDLSHITMFDNHAYAATASNPGCESNCSRLLHLKLDFDRMTARVVAAYPHPLSVQAAAMGGYQTLPGSGNILAGWGMVPSITEHRKDGRNVMDLQLSPFSSIASRGGAWIYRAYQMDWVGKPTWDPALVADEATNKAYVSWNGATEVASWQLVSIPQSPSYDHVYFLSGIAN